VGRPPVPAPGACSPVGTPAPARMAPAAPIPSGFGMSRRRGRVDDSGLALRSLLQTRAKRGVPDIILLFLGGFLTSLSSLPAQRLPYTDPSPYPQPESPNPEPQRPTHPVSPQKNPPRHGADPPEPPALPLPARRGEARPAAAEPKRGKGRRNRSRRVSASRPSLCARPRTAPVRRRQPPVSLQPPLPSAQARGSEAVTPNARSPRLPRTPAHPAGSSRSAHQPLRAGTSHRSGDRQHRDTDASVANRSLPSPQSAH